jgi:tRNA (guanine37-N1)-methyltransferase
VSALCIDVVSLFPEMVEHAARFGVTGRARERGLWQLRVWNPRDFATDSYRTIDDRPYGGGPGMVMMAGPLAAAIGAAREAQKADGCATTHTIHLTPAGAPLTHERVVQLARAQAEGYVLVAGRYEGIDERLAATLDEEIAVGDFVVSGGELPALMVIDALARQLPGALNDAESAVQESFAAGLLDCPHYTRPETYEGHAVPPVLLSGDHARIARWRHAQALWRTRARRPDLWARRTVSAGEARLLEELEKQGLK